MMYEVTLKGVIGSFFARLQQYTGASWLDKLSMEFQSNQETEKYHWLGMPPSMQEWVGRRLLKGIREQGLSITNKPYQTGMEWPASWMRRDKTGQLQIRLDEMAQRTVSHWGYLLSLLIANGTGDTYGLCYDGQYFFDSDHSEGDSGTQRNLLTADQVTELNVTAAAKPTAAEAVSAILGVIAYMLKYVDDTGEYLNSEARNFMVMTGPELWMRLCPAVINPTINQGDTNTIKSLAQDGFNVSIECNPRLSAWTTQFAVFRTDAPAKSFIRQNEMGVEVEALGKASDYYFETHRYRMGVNCRRAVGYGYWQYAAHATLS